jgi:5-methylcytosine-specific restriction endonuclease McrA
MNSASRRVDIPTIMVISHFFGSRQRQKPGVDVKGTSLRYLYKLYNGTCQYCLEHIPMNKATKDHVFPKSQGGPNCSTNLVLACKRCNALKADTFPYFNKDGEEPKVKNLSPFHHHTVYGPGMIRDEWKFFLHVN